MKPSENKGKFAQLLKTKKTETPVQEVRPITAAATEVKPIEVHVNFWADPALIERVKVHGVLTKKTIKQICSEALEAYLSAHSR